MPSFALALSLFVLSQSAILVRLAQEASALDIGLWRMLLAVPMLLLLAAGQRKLGELKRVRIKQLGALAVCGFALYVHWFSWFLAVKQTSLANSMVFFAISPLFTAMGAWFFFREAFERRHAWAMGLCLLGVLLIFRDSLRFEPGHLRGDLLALVSSALFSVYVLVSKRIRRQLENVPFTVFTYSFSAFLFAASLLLMGKGIRYDWEQGTWIALLLLAIGPTLLGHALFTYCLQFFNVNLMSILVLTEPLMGSLAAYIFIHEPITRGVVLGFFTISCGVLALFVPLLVKRDS